MVQKIFSVDITNQAYEQIEEICNYIAQDDPIRAVNFGMNYWPKQNHYHMTRIEDDLMIRKERGYAYLVMVTT